MKLHQLSCEGDLYFLIITTLYKDGSFEHNLYMYLDERVNFPLTAAARTRHLGSLTWGRCAPPRPSQHLFHPPKNIYVRHIFYHLTIGAKRDKIFSAFILQIINKSNHLARDLVYQTSLDGQRANILALYFFQETAMGRNRYWLVTNE